MLALSYVSIAIITLELVKDIKHFLGFQFAFFADKRLFLYWINKSAAKLLLNYFITDSTCIWCIWIMNAFKCCFGSIGPLCPQNQGCMQYFSDIKGIMLI